MRETRVDKPAPVAAQPAEVAVVSGVVALQMIKEGKIQKDSLRITEAGVATFKGADGKPYRGQLTKEERAAVPSSALSQSDRVALSSTAAKKPYGSDSEGHPRTPLFPEMQNFAVMPDRPTLTVGANVTGNANQPFRAIRDDFRNQETFPSQDYQGSTNGSGGIRYDSRIVAVAVEAKTDGFIETQGVPQGRAMADEAYALRAEYNRRMAMGDIAGAWALYPQAEDLMNRAKDYELKLKAQGQLTVDTQIIGRLPLPDFGPIKDLAISGKLNMHYIPNSGRGAGNGDFPSFEHLMGRIDYTGDMKDLTQDSVMSGNAYWNSHLKATMPTSNVGAGFGLGIGSKITPHFRWGFSVDNIYGYIPGKTETWEKRDNVAQGQPDFTSGYTKTGETRGNVYRTFMAPTYNLTLAGVVPQTGTQLMFSETVKQGDPITSSTFVGAQQPIGPVDLGLGYTYRSLGTNLISAGVGIHFTKDTTLRVGGFTNSFDPEKAKDVGASSAFEVRF